MFPIIPLLCWLFTAAGVGGLLWYYALSKEQQLRADRLAADYAQRLFNKTVSELTKAEAKTVYGQVKEHFLN